MRRNTALVSIARGFLIGLLGVWALNIVFATGGSMSRRMINIIAGGVIGAIVMWLFGIDLSEAPKGRKIVGTIILVAALITLWIFFAGPTRIATVSMPRP
jgi:hypothetical protein